MPVRHGRDSQGPYYRWGESGKKYRYSAGNREGRLRAKRRARRQGRDILARQGGGG